MIDGELLSGHKDRRSAVFAKPFCLFCDSLPPNRSAGSSKAVERLSAFQSELVCLPDELLQFVAFQC